MSTIKVPRFHTTDFDNSQDDDVFRVCQRQSRSLSIRGRSWCWKQIVPGSTAKYANVHVYERWRSNWNIFKSCVCIKKGKLCLIGPHMLYYESNGQVRVCCKLWKSIRNMSVVIVYLLLYIETSKILSTAKYATVHIYERWRFELKHLRSCACITKTVNFVS